MILRLLFHWINERLLKLFNSNMKKSIHTNVTNSKGLSNLLLIAFFSLLGLQTSLAQLTVSNNETVTISVDTYYTSLTVKQGGTLIVLSPAVLTIGAPGTP